MQPEDHLRSLILHAGPVDIATFMAVALGHPDGGYYMRGDPFGAGGDFTTAPEISQMFGEMIGAWCADIWRKLGSPQRFVMAECGPGRGTLMADALRVTAKVPGFHAAMEVHLIETSPVLREKQAYALKDFAPRWHNGLEGLPADAPLILLANEFLDALPMRQAQKTPDGWRERVVGLDGQGGFIFGLGAPLDINPPPGGEVFEFSPVRDAVTGDIARRLRAQRGAALFVDYGYEKTACGDTLQAVKDHEFAPVLADIGKADITSHVDFESVARAAGAEGAAVCGPVEQGAFLQRLGIGLRAAMLKQNADPAQAQAIDAALSRLTSDSEMGKLFKVMALCHENTLIPEGF